MKSIEHYEQLAREAKGEGCREVCIVVDIKLSNGQHITLTVAADPSTLTPKERELVVSLVTQSLTAPPQPAILNHDAEQAETGGEG